jgi:peptidoglycan/LPS O-acetylase OafA/YrhL
MSVERGQRGARNGYRLGGALWVVVGVVCAGLFIVVFVGEHLLSQNPGLAAAVAAAALAALLTAGMLLVRPGPVVVRWSSVLALALLIVFGSVFVSALGGADYGPMLSSGLIIVFSVAGALVSYLAGRSGPPSRVS